MLNSIRKFSKTIYAKVFLGIVVAPFILWGMGDIFRGGKQNTILEIDNRQISVQKFADYFNTLGLQPQDINNDIIELAFSNFIAQNLLDVESEKFQINISDSSLIKILKNNKDFKSNNNFSRTKYEKFLITNNLSAIQFENKLRKNEKKNQLLNFISGGIKSPSFLINMEYDLNNQIRKLLVIDLNYIYIKELNFTDQKINEYYEKNIEKFNDNYRSVKYINITPKILTGESDYSNSFFEKLDQIEDLIISENNINEISKKFNFEIKTSELFNNKGKKINSEIISAFKIDLIKKIFEINAEDPLVLINEKDDYLLIELEKNKEIPKKITSETVRNEILSILKQKKITKKNSDLIAKIINNKFTKVDFDKLASDNKVKINKINLHGINDTKKINKELIKNIYLLPKDKIYIFSNSDLTENLLVYLKEIEHVNIDKSSKEYEKYQVQTNQKIIKNIFNTYDAYVNKIYNIDINNNAMERVKNYFK